MQSNSPSDLDSKNTISGSNTLEQEVKTSAQDAISTNARSTNDMAGSSAPKIKDSEAANTQALNLSSEQISNLNLSVSYTSTVSHDSSSTASSFRPKTIMAVPSFAQEAKPEDKSAEATEQDGVLAQTEKLLSKGFSKPISHLEADKNSLLQKDKPQLDNLDRDQWIAQTSAYNQKILNRFEVKPLCDPVGKPLSNPHGTPASKPFLDLPTDFLNTTIDCHDGICEVIEGEELSINLDNIDAATAPRSEVLTEPLLAEDITVTADDGLTEALPPLTEALPPLTEELPPLTEALPPLTEALPPLTEPLPPLTEDLPPLTEPLPPLTEALPPLTEALPPLTEALPPLTDPLPPLTEALPPLTEPLPPLTEPLDVNYGFDQNHIQQTNVLNQLQATSLNLEPLSQKSASQALDQGANSPIQTTLASLPISGNLDLGNLSTPLVQDVNPLSQGTASLSPLPQTLGGLTNTLGGMSNNLGSMANNFGGMAPLRTPMDASLGANHGVMATAPSPAQITAKAVQAAQAQIKGTHTSDESFALHNQTEQQGLNNNDLDPMFCFQQSMAQGYSSNQQPNSAFVQNVEPVSNSQANDNMALHSVHSFNKISRMPGLVLYKLKTNTVFYDYYAAEFLGIGTEAGSCSLRQFLHLIGRPVVHDLIVRLKPLKDELKISADNVCTSLNVVNLSCVLPHGLCKGATVYVKVAAFFDENSNVRYFTFTFMRQMPNNMAFIPDLLTNNTSFAWLVQEDKLSLSQHYYKLLGYPEQNEPLILSFSTWENTLVHPHDRVAIKKIQPIIDSPSQGNSFEICYRSRKINGTYIWTKSIGTVVARDASGKATRIIGVNCDINEMVDGYDRLRSKVYTDVLTGLKNRTYLVQHVRDFIQPQMQPLSILFFDATALKLYNDYLGHAMGDKLLFSIANILNENIAFENELIRISGDEMLCVLPMCDELMLQMVMDDISLALEAYNANAPVRMPVFFSMGNITINLNTQLYNRMRMQYAKQLRTSEQDNVDHTRLFNQHVALNRTLAWQNWTPSDKQLDTAYELFFQAVQQADKNMQEAKQANREEHYSLIRAYIEQTLHKRIDIDDKRLLNIDRGMLA